MGVIDKLKGRMQGPMKTGFPVTQNNTSETNKKDTQVSAPFNSNDSVKMALDSSVNNSPQGQLVDLDSTVKGMQEYKAHQANIPQYVPGSSIGDKFNTTMKRVVHNLTGPKNPNLIGGTLPVGGAGRAGVVKGLFKLAAKGIKKYREKN